ncbi:MAG: PP2C family protein-serine/threonine phosphatase [Gemmatimonadales bacterium]
MSPERLWLFEDGQSPRLAHGSDPGWTPVAPDGPGLVLTPDGPRRMLPVRGEPGLWVDAAGDSATADSTAEILDQLLRAEREVARLTQELASRYEEIDLLYTISEILGQTVRLEQAARTIVRAVASVVGARRASIMVHDEERDVLRTVAAQGLPPGRAGMIPVADPRSIAARVFRDQRPMIGDSVEGAAPTEGKEERGYQGVAFMSVPISYAAPGAPSRCIGVVNLTDRVGGDRFAPTDRKLVTAIANQIGAALENARLAEREREQERLERELELASRLQQSLLPSPAVLAGDAEVAVRCVPLESVGGDFYAFNRLGQGSIGVMVGDVSNHGFSAALLMASAVSASAIHSAASTAPDQVLSSLRASLTEKLAPSDSYLTVFYARLDPSFGRLVYANAGHPHAFRIPGHGEPVRLEATAAPLGLADDSIGYRVVPWVRGEDLLVVYTDGLIEAASATGERFGERRVLELVTGLRDRDPEAIVAAVMDAVGRFEPEASDDRTLLVLRA